MNMVEQSRTIVYMNMVEQSRTIDVPSFSPIS